MNWKVIGIHVNKIWTCDILLTFSGYNIDWLRTVKGQSKVVVKPKTTQEVCDLVKYCHEQEPPIAISVQGGNTGLVGGSVPVFDELILSTTLMNQIESSAHSVTTYYPII